jgi:hypothetical protein
MPSLADATVRRRLRVALEHTAHVLALAIVAWLLFQSLRGSPGGAAGAADIRSLPAELARWSTVAVPERVHVRIDSAISPAQRDWLAALGAAGARVSWEGDGVMPVAAVAEPVADPGGGTRIWAAAPAGTTVTLDDAYGVLDSMKAGPGGARFLAQSAPREVRVRAGALVARGAVRDSLTFGRLLVLGAVGWESKFVVAALEERGWEVDARLALSPKGDVVQGGALALDTARYSAVIVLDSSSLVSASRIAPYVRSGGGLVLTAPASVAPALASLRAGTAARGLLPAVEPFDPEAAEPRRALALAPIALRADALMLQQRDSAVAVAARRVGQGRVIMIGYADTWRWRMGGDEDAVEEHRSWWAGLVAGVAHVNRAPLPGGAVVDEAPLARLVDRLGPASPAPAKATTRHTIPPALLFGVLAAALLLEWLSRRLRGAS